jgi:hypothetical protein
MATTRRTIRRRLPRVVLTILAALSVVTPAYSRGIKHRNLRTASSIISNDSGSINNNINSTSASTTTQLLSFNPLECFVCHIVQFNVLFEYNEEAPEKQQQVIYNSSSSTSKERDDKDYLCISNSRKLGYREVFSISLPDDFVEANRNDIHDGVTNVCIKGAVLDVADKIVHIPYNATLSLAQDESHHRRLQNARIGNKRLLVIRVVSPFGEEPDESIELIQGTIFGTGKQAQNHSVVSQYKAVSHGAFGYIPAEGDNIDGGVAQVMANVYVKGSKMSPSFQDVIKEAAVEKLGDLEDIADMVIYCIPDGSYLFDSDQWTGFTFLYETVSANKQDVMC